MHVGLVCIGDSDEGKYHVNWEDPNIGDKQRKFKREEPLDDAWFEDEELAEAGFGADENPDEEYVERRMPRRRAPERPRRPRTRYLEGASPDSQAAPQATDLADAPAKRTRRERREPWRPPVFRPTARRGRDVRERDDRVGRRDRVEERSDKGRGRPERQPRQQLRKIKLEPPVRPVNLEAMAAKGLPKMNLYQLEPYDFDYYVIRELGQAKQVAKQLREWIYEKGCQDFMKIPSIAMGVRHSLVKLASAGADDWKIIAEQESNDGTVK
ncbi:rlmN1, partial [Symbiodinium pilosum]